MAQSLMAIAAFIATVGVVIFGVSRYEKSGKEEGSIELVSRPDPRPDPRPDSIVKEPPAIPEAVRDESAIAQVPEVIEPIAEVESAELVAEVPEVVEPAEPIAEVVEPSEPIDLESEVLEPRNEVAEVVLPPAIQDPKRETAIEPRAEVISVLIPPTIHDPKRPNDGIAEDLTQDIVAWGQSKDLKHVAKLMQYSTHRDPIVRSHVATALGQIVSNHSVTGDIERSIPVLGKMTYDSDLKVRLYAVQSLGMIRSEKVLPYLEKALLSPSGSVMKSANRALQNLKLHYGKSPAMQMAEKMLEKPRSKC